MTDTEMLDWLEQNLVGLLVIRDVKRGSRFILDYDTSNGCTTSVQGKSLRKAINLCLTGDRLPE